MKTEVHSRLVEARDLLLECRKTGAPPLRLDTLEDLCRALLEQFEETGKTRFFELFYAITRHLFTAYTHKMLKKYGARVEPMTITNGLYAIIFRKLTAPHEKIPLDYLLPWCYRVIVNVTREEKRKILHHATLSRTDSAENSPNSQLDRMILVEEESHNARLLERVMEILCYGEKGLSDRDRNIMQLFYLEDMPLKEIAATTGLTQSNVGVILKRARAKIAKIVRIEKPTAINPEINRRKGKSRTG
jgi:RNA polymerase sigma factor (sigma-70 family)